MRSVSVVAAALLCGWLLMRWAYPPLQCDFALTALTRRTELVSESTADYIRLSRLRRNLEDLRAVESQCRTNVSFYMLVAANEEMLGHYDDAVRSYSSALAVDRRPEIHAALGWALIRLGRHDEAAQHYAIAARFLYPIALPIPSEIVERRVAEILRAEQ